MDLEFLEKQKQVVVGKFGPWTASNIHVAGDLFTIGKRIHGDEIKLRRIVQVVSDTSRRPLQSLRLLDLACHEGIYAIEFARHGARVVGIEGQRSTYREGQICKGCAFSRQA